MARTIARLGNSYQGSRVIICVHRASGDALADAISCQSSSKVHRILLRRCDKPAPLGLAGLPTQPSAFRKWARVRFSALGVASAVYLDRSNGLIPENTPGPHRWLERVAKWRKHATNLAGGRAHATPIAQPPTLLETFRTDDPEFGVELIAHPGIITLIGLDDQDLTCVADTLTFNPKLWNRTILICTTAVSSPAEATRVQCWIEALGAFTEAHHIATGTSAEADAREILDWADRAPGGA